MTGTRIDVFSKVCIPECFLTVLSWCCLILFGILSSIICNLLFFPYLIFYVTFGEVCFLLMLIERSREVGVSAGTSICSTFLYSVA